MSARPTILPEVLAALTERTPPRIRKKLDGAPGAAEAWTWSASVGSTSVTTDGGEVVSLTHTDGRVVSVDHVACSCLLAPRCFHVIAAASALPIDAGDATSTTTSATTTEAQAPARTETVPRALDESAGRAARGAGDALATALTMGLSALGATDRAELLRAVHAARVAGLHRIASRVLTVAESSRALRERSAAFDLDEVVEALGDALGTTRRIERGLASVGDVGVARRAYGEVGALRLLGIASEPVVTRTGMAGIVTYVASDRRELYTVDDVMPGSAERAQAAYASMVRFGEASLTHENLSRGGLFITNATASADHRLGAGARVAAVGAAGVRFDESPLRELFAVPFSDQLERALSPTPDMAPSRAASLVFLTGVVLGGEPRAVLFEIGSGPAVRLVAGDDDPRFPWAENLRLLGGATGAELAVVARVPRSRAGFLEAIAVAPRGPGLRLLDQRMGRVNLAFDALGRSQIEAPAAGRLVAASLTTAEPVAPLGALERRLARMVLGGRRSLTAHHAGEVSQEAALLRACMAPTAARALEGLLVAAEDARPRAFAEERRASAAARALSDAWVGSYLVLGTITDALERAAWRRSMNPET